MKCCQYHPLVPATFNCDYCQTSQCDLCVDEGDQGENHICFMCRNKVDSLGAIHSAEPFWRRFQEVFRYPLKTETAVFIVAMAFLNIAIVFLPFTIIWFLILSGIFMKYCFCCLEKTAKGSLVPPNVSAAYDGGIILSLKLIAILFIIGFSIVGVQFWLGTAIGTFFGVLALCCCPAIIINFSLSESVVDAVNPLKILSLIAAIGLPYGLLLAIILIMSGSVSFINELISSETSIISLGLQTAVSNYYTLVVFHLMGYMLFQYQGQLGFIARKEEDDAKAIRSAAERTLANIEVHVKEGYYDEALLLFQEGIKKHNKNKTLHDKCLELLLATKNIPIIDAFVPMYISFLVKNQAKDQLTFIYKKILRVYPNFIPNTPADKLLLAQECWASGDSLSVVRLLNGIHKQSPNFSCLIPALELMAEALKDLPNMTRKSKEFDLFLTRFKGQKEKGLASPNEAIRPKVSFEPKEARKPKAPINPQASINVSMSIKPKARIKAKHLEKSLSLEDQIKENAEKFTTKISPVRSGSIPDNKKESGTDYDGGIDFS
jgi:hypothetical protein